MCNVMTTRNTHYRHITQTHKESLSHKNATTLHMPYLPLSTAVGADNAHATVHIEAEVKTAEEPGKVGGVLEIHIAHFHNGGRQGHHLG